MGKIWSVIAIALIAAFFMLPVAAGCGIPRSFSAGEVGEFVGEILRYWLQFARAVYVRT